MINYSLTITTLKFSTLGEGVSLIQCRDFAQESYTPACLSKPSNSSSQLSDVCNDEREGGKVLHALGE